MDREATDRRTVDATACEVAVVGGGPAGLLAALLIARTGAETAVVSPPPRPDARTTALLQGSVAVLKAAGVWEELAPLAAPLKTLRLLDASRRLFRAPEATFHAAELGLEAFGWNVPNTALTTALDNALLATSSARVFVDHAASCRPGEKAVELTLAGGRLIEARLAVAADGRNSMLREAAEIDFKSREVPQTALAFAVSHVRDHQFVSTELHTEHGPFTLVPMPGRRSSVVWATSPDRARALRSLSPRMLGDTAAQTCARLLGAMTVEGAVGCFPITIGSATCFAARRTLLVGEAGHVLPPIGAQGLNLGVRDAAAAAEIVRRARGDGRDVGGDEALRAYARARAADVWSRTAATDLLNRSLLTDFAPAHALRGIGLAALSRIGPLRRLVMREGLAGGPAF